MGKRKKIEKEVNKVVESTFVVLREFSDKLDSLRKANYSPTDVISALNAQFPGFDPLVGICSLSGSVVRQQVSTLDASEQRKFTIGAEADDRIDKLFKKCFSTYQHYSGNIDYPVSHPLRDEALAFTAMGPEMWVKGQYAKRRRLLLKHFINYATTASCDQ